MTGQPPVPVIVVTGALGVGKTTAIANALAAKPEAQRWVVILNEFTDSGIDVLTVAGAARGEFDVRLVEAGCLCCVGAEDFSRTLAGFVRGPRPMRLYVEPSGLGDPAVIIEELLAYEARGEIELVAVVALVDAQRLQLVSTPGTARDQVDAADIVLLAQADRATTAERARFLAWAESLYPPKRLVGECRDGVLPPLPAPPPSGFARPVHESGPVPAGARHAAHGRAALSFTFPPVVAFDESRLVAAFESAGELQGVERLKGVFRIGPSAWRLIQRSAAGVSVRESAWRRDSRVELLAADGVRLDRAALARFWGGLAARPGADRR